MNHLSSPVGGLNRFHRFGGLQAARASVYDCSSKEADVIGVKTLFSSQLLFANRVLGWSRTRW